MKPRLLLVDDDPLITESLAFVLGPDFELACASDRASAVATLRDMAGPPDLALIDLGLPPAAHLPTEGFKLIGDLLAHAPDVRIVVLTGQNEESNARRARALGAADLVPKPCEPDDLRALLQRVLRSRELAATPDSAEDGRVLIGDSPPMRKLRSQIDLYASSGFPALIEGESGSGKERVAFSLHHLSPRAREPFLALNCAAISPTLVEPTLFGYAKGAFTGAVQSKAGYFEDAAEGTLFLDEIGELPVDLQAKLLRVLENGEYQRVGETQTRVSRARIVAATNRDLRQEIRQGRFRADLYHRLSVFSIAVPPLRELGEDRLQAPRALPPGLLRARGNAALRARRRRPGALARVRLPGQRARASQHRDPPQHQVRRLHGDGGGPRAGTRPGPGGNGRRGRGQAGRRPGRAGLRPPVRPGLGAEGGRGDLPRRRHRALAGQHVAGGAAPGHLPQHPVQPPRGVGARRC